MSTIAWCSADGRLRLRQGVLVLAAVSGVFLRLSPSHERQTSRVRGMCGRDGEEDGGGGNDTGTLYEYMCTLLLPILPVNGGGAPRRLAVVWRAARPAAR